MNQKQQYDINVFKNFSDFMQNKPLKKYSLKLWTESFIQIWVFLGTSEDCFLGF